MFEQLGHRARYHARVLTQHIALGVSRSARRCASSPFPSVRRRPGTIPSNTSRTIGRTAASYTRSCVDDGPKTSSNENSLVASARTAPARSPLEPPPPRRVNLGATRALIHGDDFGDFLRALFRVQRSASRRETPHTPPSSVTPLVSTHPRVHGPNARVAFGVRFESFKPHADRRRARRVSLAPRIARRRSRARSRETRSIAGSFPDPVASSWRITVVVCRRARGRRAGGSPARDRPGGSVLSHDPSKGDTSLARARAPRMVVPTASHRLPPVARRQVRVAMPVTYRAERTR